MKYIFIFCFFFLSFSQLTFSQWVPQSSGVTEGLYSVYFFDDQTGWAVGNNGVIVNTTDGGNNWSEQVSGTTNYFNSVFFTSGSDGWAVGGNFSPNLGMVHHTTDGGATWPVQTDTLPNQLNSVFFISPTTGWAAGESSQILKTTDSGLNWLLQSAEVSYYRGIFFINENTGWAVGGNPSNTFSTIIKTTNGGTNWIAQTAATNNYLRAVFFISETTGWVAGNESTIFKTTDGGSNWVSQNSGSTEGLYSIQFADINTGWMSGGSGLILYTTDGGSNWTVQTTGTNQHLNSISFPDANNGWAVGSNGTILHTINGGIPVELISFTAEVYRNERTVEISWSTATETNNSGFEILRAIKEDEWNKIGFVPGHGTTTEKQHYLFTDNDVKPGRYQYKLKQIDFDGTFEYSQIIEVEIALANKFSLSQNYPNPFNPSTKISYSIPELSFVTLKVYDVLGNEVVMLVNEEKPAGNYEVEFDSHSGSVRNLTSGIYFYSLTAGSFTQTKKMILLR